jgi:hypothetical protein
VIDITVNVVTGDVREVLGPEELLNRNRAAMKCSARQARLALLGAGILDSAQSAVANSGNQAMQISWEYATEWHRTDPMIDAISAALGLDGDAVDALFVRAAFM